MGSLSKEGQQKTYRERRPRLVGAISDAAQVGRLDRENPQENPQENPDERGLQLLWARHRSPYVDAKRGRNLADAGRQMDC
jgi:hypothetical protein